MTLETYRHKLNCLQLRVDMDKGVLAAGMGLLLAVCTENPEAMRPCLQNPVSIFVTLTRMSGDPAERSAAEDLIGPLKSLAKNFAMCPPSYKRTMPWGRNPRKGPRSVVKGLSVVLVLAP